MRGDFSRLRFEKTKHYTSVLEQQGRVALDADHNEQRAIDEHLHKTETVDIIGPFGGPENDAGFAITSSGKTIQIGAGRYYVQGILCENEAQLSYGSQPYLIHPAVSDSDLLTELAGGSLDSIRLFLQVWQRLVTALDDPCLREPALGPADTTVRRQTVWRVIAQTIKATQPSPSPFPTRTARARRLLEKASTLARVTPSLTIQPGRVARNLGTAVPGITLPGTTTVPGTATAPGAAVPVNCCAEMYQPATVLPSGGLSAQTTGGSSECSCEPTPAAGYRGLENQLYRVEIHQGGNESQATFKWSRENGSVLTAITGISGADVMVGSLGLDANLGFQPGQWVELSDDTYLFGPNPNQPGELFQIKSINAEQRTITMTAAVAQVDPTRNARLRRWEQSGTAATAGGMALAAGSWLDLENGIQVQFAPGHFESGDYWLLPARTATGQIEWPPCGSDGAAFQPPHRTEVYLAPLACIHWDAKKQLPKIDDCRRSFPPLTEVAGGALSALHITAINWNNDDVVPFDQLLAKGLTVTLDQAPTGRIDSSTFAVTLEVPVVSPVEAGAVKQGLTPIVLRTSMPLDGQITVQKQAVNWNIPFRDSKGEIPGVQLEALLILNAMLFQGMNYSSFVRARVSLSGANVFAGDGSSRAYLDGESFGTPGVRADGITPRMDLTFPSGVDEEASDFASWFFLAPTFALTGLVVQPPAVVFTPTAPNPPAPVATLTTNYPALVDTVVALSVISPTGGPSAAATVPTTVTIPKGKSSVTFPVGVRNTQVFTAQTFQITASLTNALGFANPVSAPLTITGFTVIQ